MAKGCYQLHQCSSLQRWLARCVGDQERMKGQEVTMQEGWTHVTVAQSWKGEVEEWCDLGVTAGGEHWWWLCH